MGATVFKYSGTAFVVVLVTAVCVTLGWALGGWVHTLAQIPDFWRFALAATGGVIAIRLLQKAFVEV